MAGVAVLPAITGSDSQRETFFTVLLSVGLASSLNILLGYTGYVSFGNIVFFGLGGYVGFFLIDVLGHESLPGGAVRRRGVGVAGVAVGLSILRLRGSYFALATIGVNEAMRALIYNLDFLGGPTGMELNFRVYQGYGGPRQMLWMVYWSVVAVTLVVVLVSFTVKHSKFGLSLMAIREDEDAAEVMGVVGPRAKTYAYVLSAIFPGILGALYFFKQGRHRAEQRLPAASVSGAAGDGNVGRPGDIAGPSPGRRRLSGAAGLAAHHALCEGCAAGSGGRAVAA